MTQWSHTFPAGSTASGSSTTRASEAVPAGTPEIASGGFTFAAVYPYRSGIGAPSSKAELCRWSAIGICSHAWYKFATGRVGIISVPPLNEDRCVGHGRICAAPLRSSNARASHAWRERVDDYGGHHHAGGRRPGARGPVSSAQCPVSHPDRRRRRPGRIRACHPGRFRVGAVDHRRLERRDHCLRGRLPSRSRGNPRGAVCGPPPCHGWCSDILRGDRPRRTLPAGNELGDFGAHRGAVDRDGAHRRHADSGRRPRQGPRRGRSRDRRDRQ